MVNEMNFNEAMLEMIDGKEVIRISTSSIYRINDGEFQYQSLGSREWNKCNKSIFKTLKTTIFKSVEPEPERKLKVYNSSSIEGHMLPFDFVLVDDLKNQMVKILLPLQNCECDVVNNFVKLVNEEFKKIL